MKTALDIKHCIQTAIEVDATFVIILYDSVEVEQFAQYVVERSLIEVIAEIEEVHSWTVLTIYAIGVTDERELSRLEQESGYRINGISISDEAKE